jgi:hypothetical protein
VDLFELTVLPTGVLVWGTDPRFRRALLGRVNSTWLFKGCLLEIEFFNFTFRRGPVLAARLDGDGWHYNVFED